MIDTADLIEVNKEHTIAACKAAAAAAVRGHTTQKEKAQHQFRLNDPVYSDYFALFLISHYSGADLIKTTDTLAHEVWLDARKAAKPLPIYNKSLYFDTRLLRSALFSAGTGDRATCPTHVDVFSHGSDIIEYKGEVLRQDDLRVLMGLLKSFVKDGCGTVVFVPRIFCRNIGWSDCGSSVTKLKASLTRLQDASVRVTDYQGTRYYQFIASITHGKGYSLIQLDATLLLPYGQRRTFVSMDERFSMKDGLLSWVYLFIKADSCFAPFKLSSLHSMSGLVNYEQREFARHLKKALTALQESGVIASFAVKAGTVTVKKATKASKASKAAAARREIEESE